MKKSAAKWVNFDFAEIGTKNELNTEVKSKANKNLLKIRNKTVTSRALTRNISQNFQKQLAPKEIADLAIHPKKIKEVEDWFKAKILNPSVKKTANFLLITGPTGSGKSSIIQVLCRVNGLTLSEWVNPLDHDFDTFRGLNQVEKFTEFLTESKWNSLFGSSDKKVILVEEFPNAILRTPELFPDILEETYYKGNYSVIFICTESFENNQNSPSIIQTLFPQELRDKFGFIHISFNACASTIMKNALKRAQNLVQKLPEIYKTPSSHIIDTIISASMGDIRCAVNQFYFASLLGSDDVTIAINISSNGQKSGRKRKRYEKVSTLMSKDENLGLFHGLGRVLNPKRIEINDSDWRIDCDIEKLIDEFNTQPKMFLSFLHANYIKYFGAIEDIYSAAEILSDAQTFLDVWTEREDTLLFALWIAVVGLMIANQHRVNKWTQIRGPNKLKKQSKEAECRNLSATDLFYYNLIKYNRKTTNYRVDL